MIRWPWDRTRREQKDELAELRRVRAESAARLQEDQARWPEVRAAASAQRDTRRRNHLGELLEEAFRIQP